MTKRMLASKDAGGAVAALVAGNTNLQKDLEASKKGDKAFREYVDENYKSDGDYWLVHNDGHISWDGHLNFYKEGKTDKENAEAGKILDYTKLDEIIANAEKEGKTKVTLGDDDTEVEVSRLKEIQAHNKNLIDAGKKSNSIAAQALLNDGFMSKTEADASLDEIRNREINSGLKNLAKNLFTTFFTTEKAAFDSYNSSSDLVDVIEHYSTRYVLNDNEEFRDMFSRSNIDNNINSKWYNEQLEYGKSVDNLKNVTALLLPKSSSVYHGENCLKWQFENGRELVLGYNGGKRFFEEREQYFGTFNYGLDGTGVKHQNFDVVPYWKWGNTPDDNTTNKARIYPLIEKIFPTQKYSSRMDLYYEHH